jgi:hypothetical protein
MYVRTPKVDFVFKRVCGDARNADILINLLRHALDEWIYARCHAGNVGRVTLRRARSL